MMTTTKPLPATLLGTSDGPGNYFFFLSTNDYFNLFCHYFGHNMFCFGQQLAPSILFACKCHASNGLQAKLPSKNINV